MIVSKDLETFVSLAEKQKVETEEDYQNATEMLLKVKAAEKRAEEEKNKVLKPLKEAVKAETNRWKPLEAVIEKINSILRPRMKKYIDAKEEKARQELAKLQKDIDKGRIKNGTTIAKREDEIYSSVPATTVHTGSGASNVRKVAKLKIVNPELIPDEYWIIDEVKLRKDVVTLEKTVPGAERVFENSIAIL